MSDIRPIDLPTAAGVEYGRGDVRHFSEDDAVGVVGLQTPTRHLAERDNLLAEKLNEVVATVNNKEQFVPLTVPRTSVAPGVEEIVTNFKIPAGFEARILSASVGSNPVTAAIALKIYYSNGYGSVTGTELVSTSSTFSSGVAFYNSGEFIVALRNNGASVLEIAASITLTIRPIGSTASLLVGSVIQGRQGYPGRMGDPGQQGNPGVGGTGTPGLNYRGTFNAANSYSPPDVVSWTSSGVTQSYVCVLANPGPGSALPSNGTYWDILASSGSPGTAGSGLNWLGAWSSGLGYAVNDSVSYTSAGLTSTYICTTAHGPTGSPPNVDTANWDLMAGPGGGETPTYAVTDVSGLVSYSAWPTQSNPMLPYTGYGQSSISSPLPALTFVEYSVTNTLGSPKGMVFLQGQRLVRLATNPGTITFTLHTSPTASAWNTTNTMLTVVNHGTAEIMGGTNAQLVTVDTPASNQYTIKNWGTQDAQISIGVWGLQPKT